MIISICPLRLDKRNTDASNDVNLAHTCRAGYAPKDVNDVGSETRYQPR